MNQLLNTFSRYRSPAQRVDLSQFHDTSIQLLIGFTCLLGIGFALVGADLGFDSMDAAILALALMIPGMIAMFLYPSQPRWSLWILFLDWLACGLALVFSPAIPFALVLLVFPIFFAVLFISPFIGLLTWLGTGSLTYFWFSWSPLPGLPPGWGIFFFTSGVFVGILWQCLRSYQEMIAWSWQNYEQNSAELSQAREHRGQLNQAIHDLTEANTQMIRLNQLLNAARYQAEEAERVKAEFVANVSHELRTPLNMILGYCELIMDFPSVYGRKLPARLLADIAAVQRNSQHLVTLITDVLDISQIEAKKMVLRKDWVAIQNVVNEVVIAVQPLVESRSLYMRTDVQENLSLLYIDQTRIRQVLLNLVSNAARVTESGGITILVETEGDFLKVCVSDTGPGIADEDLAKLFQPFRQLDGSL
jgi:signal transduction histidine kinase